MPKIKKISAREILDSGGVPTIETKVVLDNGVFGIASVPSSNSTGKNESLELRDRDLKRYGGMGVLRAIENIEKKIFPALEGMEVEKQQEIDEKMIEIDASDNKMNLGSNAIFSVSCAVARAAANSKGLELFEYLSQKFSLEEQKIASPCFNFFSGGKYADTNLDFQEFMLIPLKNCSFDQKIRMGSEIFQELAKVLRRAGFDTDTGSEGGYAPDMVSSIQAMEFIVSAGINAGYKPKSDFGIGIDIGSSTLFDSDQKKYIFKLDRNLFVGHTLMGLYDEWLKDFPLVYLEDGLAEGEWEDWKKLTAQLGNKILLAGDTLFSTNINLLRRGLKEKAANTIVIKANQVGTLSETIECVKLAKKYAYKIVIAHRHRETNDDLIADLAFAVGADFIKAGALSRGERVAKYNRLLEIEKLIKK